MLVDTQKQAEANFKAATNSANKPPVK
jgi:hypothetical protein